MFSGDRPTVPNVAIIVTDGQSNNPPLTAIEARKARAKGITILALGVGHGIRKSELNEMATDPDSSHVYTADNFDALASLQALLSNKACEGMHIFVGVSLCFWGLDFVCPRNCKPQFYNKMFLYELCKSNVNKLQIQIIWCQYLMHLELQVKEQRKWLRCLVILNFASGYFSFWRVLEIYSVFLFWVVGLGDGSG